MDAFELAEALRRAAGVRSDGDAKLMSDAADKIEMLQDWCRKLIEAGKFPGEIGNPLQ